MDETFRLGRISGIPIGLNWTWLLVFVVFAWSLATAVFPDTNPGLGTTAYAGMAVAAVLLFFGSLLLHELGHALEARREGVRIEGITLWLFGGVARFRGMFPSAGAEFRIAVAGPVVTALLGAAFLVLARLTRFGPAIDGVFAWLAYTNFLLLAFNLLPALPLDGGRVLRAALWQIRGDFTWATRLAAVVARGFGVLMIVAGVFAFFATGGWSAVWLALVGWFLLSAVGAETQLSSLWAALEGLVVADVMRVPPLVARAGQTLGELVAEASGSGRGGAFPVVEGDRAVGLLPSRSLLQGMPGELVRQRMLPLDEVPRLSPSDPAVDAVLELAGQDVPSALVLEDGHLVGIVRLADLEATVTVRRRPPWPWAPHDDAPSRGPAA